MICRHYWPILVGIAVLDAAVPRHLPVWCSHSKHRYGSSKTCSRARRSFRFSHRLDNSAKCARPYFAENARVNHELAIESVPKGERRLVRRRGNSADLSRLDARSVRAIHHEINALMGGAPLITKDWRERQCHYVRPVPGLHQVVPVGYLRAGWSPDRVEQAACFGIGRIDKVGLCRTETSWLLLQVAM